LLSRRGRGDYFSIDCRGADPNNAGVFLRQPGAATFGTNLISPAK
jgi:hypothetical protein